jgi:hypothetical protein
MRTDQRILEIRAGRRWPLVDEPVGLVVAGARPGSEVAVRATVEGAGTVHYTGVDPFGLWWSGQPVGPSRRPPSAPLTARVQAATAGRMAEAVLERHWLTLEAAATPVREPGVWGLFARPAGDGPFPGVVCFGGSSGGLAAAAAWAPVLASHGFATLAIAYFGVPGTPAPTEVRHPVDGASYALGGCPRPTRRPGPTPGHGCSPSWPPRAPSRGRHRAENPMGCHRDEWIAAGAVDALHRLALDAYDRMLGLDLDHLAVGLRGPGRPCRLPPPPSLLGVHGQDGLTRGSSRA